MIVYRFLLTIGVLLFYRLGCQIPLPGLDQNILAQLSSSDGGALERFSIFTLGVTPIFSVLLFVEITKMAFPVFGRWKMAHRKNAERLHRGILIAALIVAAFQALAIANNLKRILSHTEDTDLGFYASIVATLVGATALLGWLADKITLHGFGNGFWILLVTPLLTSLPNEAFGGFELWRQGYVGSIPLFVVIGYFAFSVTLSVVVAEARYNLSPRFILSPNITPKENRANEDDFESIWPPIFANSMSGLLMVFGWLILGKNEKSFSEWITIVTPYNFLVIGELIAVFTYLRHLSKLRSGDLSGADNIALPAWMIALAQIFICIGGELLIHNFNLPSVINGTWLIIFVTVATNCLASINAKERIS